MEDPSHRPARSRFSMWKNLMTRTAARGSPSEDDKEQQQQQQCQRARDDEEDTFGFGGQEDGPGVTLEVGSLTFSLNLASESEILSELGDTIDGDTEAGSRLTEQTTGDGSRLTVQSPGDEDSYGFSDHRPERSSFSSSSFSSGKASQNPTVLPKDEEMGLLPRLLASSSGDTEDTPFSRDSSSGGVAYYARNPFRPQEPKQHPLSARSPASRWSGAWPRTSAETKSEEQQTRLYWNASAEIFHPPDDVPATPSDDEGSREAPSRNPSVTLTFSDTHSVAESDGTVDAVYQAGGFPNPRTSTAAEKAWDDEEEEEASLGGGDQRSRDETYASLASIASSSSDHNHERGGGLWWETYTSFANYNTRGEGGENHTTTGGSLDLESSRSSRGTATDAAEVATIADTVDSIYLEASTIAGTTVDSIYLEDANEATPASTGGANKKEDEAKEESKQQSDPEEEEEVFEVDEADRRSVELSIPPSSVSASTLEAIEAIDCGPSYTPYKADSDYFRFSKIVERLQQKSSAHFRFDDAAAVGTSFSVHSASVEMSTLDGDNTTVRDRTRAEPPSASMCIFVPSPRQLVGSSEESLDKILNIRPMPTEDTSKLSQDKTAGEKNKDGSSHDGGSRRNELRRVIYLVWMIMTPILIFVIVGLTIGLIMVRNAQSEEAEPKTSPDAPWFPESKWIGSDESLHPVPGNGLLEDNRGFPGTVVAPEQNQTSSAGNDAGTDVPGPAPTGFSITTAPPNRLVPTPAPIIDFSVFATRSPSSQLTPSSPILPTEFPTTTLPTFSPTQDPATTNRDVDDALPSPQFLSSRFIPWSSLSEVLLPSEETDFLGYTNATDFLGYTEETWNTPGTLELESRSYESIIESGSQELRLALLGLMGLSFTRPQAWNCWINHYQDTAWGDLSRISLQEGGGVNDYGLAVLSAVQELGWTAETWTAYREDGRDRFSPRSWKKDWSELSRSEQSAAGVLCYTSQLWDRVPIPDWLP